MTGVGTTNQLSVMNARTIPWLERLADAVNPRCGRDLEYSEYNRNENDVMVAVVGGGPPVCRQH